MNSKWLVILCSVVFAMSIEQFWSLRQINATTARQQVASLGISEIPVDGVYNSLTAASSERQVPVLAFSDLTSGPRNGNTDTSKGQRSGVNGALITVWGLNLGTSMSKLTVNGAAPSAIYYWGKAVPPWSPANLNNSYQNMQEIIFQVPSAASPGAGSISVTIDGKASNALPFTVRPGRIFFVAQSGSDGSAGTFRAPFRTIQHAKDIATRPGDTIYIENGVEAATDTQGIGAVVRMNHTGTPGEPIALVAYPGASVHIGSTSLDPFQIYTSDTQELPSYLVVAKFSLTGRTLAGSGNVMRVTQGSRLVGNVISEPLACSDAGAVSTPSGSDNVILGNEFTSNGAEHPPAICGQSLYHVVYISGRRGLAPGTAAIDANRYIEWNYFHDNSGTRAINVYTESTQSGLESDLIQGNHIDHNVIINQRGDGIGLLSMSSGENWIYDNVIINAGLGPEPTDQPTQHECIHLRTSGDPRVGSTIVHMYNNTLYNCGFTSSIASGGIGITATGPTVRYDIHNNIVYQADSHLPYFDLHSISISTDPTAWSHNLWFGAGPAPAFDSNRVNANPMFVTPGINLRIQSTSPARDTGSNLGKSFLTTDLDGTPQPTGKNVDRGAYEFHP